jgi:dephospho-CoA kinase
MEQVPEVKIRRARPSDAAGIAAFVNKARPGGTPVTREAVIGRLGMVGFFIAEARGEAVGLLGWQVENLVARTTDMYVDPNVTLEGALETLIREIERASRDLQCEASLVFVTPALASGWGKSSGLHGSIFTSTCFAISGSLKWCDLISILSCKNANR